MDTVNTNTFSKEMINLILLQKIKPKKTDSTKTFSETDIIKMLESLIVYQFAMFGGRVYNRE
jgi:hypothetical protein